MRGGAGQSVESCSCFACLASRLVHLYTTWASQSSDTSTKPDLHLCPWIKPDLNSLPYQAVHTSCCLIQDGGATEIVAVPFHEEQEKWPITAMRGGGEIESNLRQKSGNRKQHLLQTNRRRLSKEMCSVPTQNFFHSFTVWTRNFHDLLRK